MSGSPNNCVHCISRSAILASCVSGLIPLKFECVRNKKKRLQIPVKISPILIVISYVHAGFLLAGTLYEFRANYDSSRSFWKLENMEAVAYLLFGLDIGFVMIFVTINAKHTRDIFLVITELMNMRGGAANKSLFKSMRYCQRNAVVYVMTTMLLTISASAYILAMKPIINFVNISKMYHYFLFTFIEGWVLGVLQALTELWFEDIKETVKLDREDRCEYRLGIDRTLKKLMHIRVADYQLIEVINRFASPPITIFLVMTIITEITGLYVTVLEIFQWMLGESVSIGRLTWLLALLPPAYCGNIAKNTLNLNDTITSHLYRIPISHLKDKERHQIEVLISILTNQPLIIKASKKFTVSWEVFIGAVYVVFTYLIIGLQFHFSEESF